MNCQYCVRPATVRIQWVRSAFGAAPGPTVPYCGECSIADALRKRGMTAPVAEGRDYKILQSAGAGAYTEHKKEPPMKVHKFTLADRGPTSLLMPMGAKPLRVGIQGETLVLWALVAPTASDTRRKFLTLWTGADVPTDATYIDSTAFHDGTVVHVFEDLL